MIKVENLELNNRAHLCLFCLDMSVWKTLMEQTICGHVVLLRYIILIPRVNSLHLHYLMMLP